MTSSSPAAPDRSLIIHSCRVLTWLLAGKHPWALQLERALSRHSRPCVGQRPSVNQTTADSDLEADIDGGKNADATQIPGQKNVKQVRQTVVELHDAVH